MVKRLTYPIILLLLLLAACGPSNVQPEPSATPSSPDGDLPETDIMPRPTITATAGPADSYPAPTPANTLPEGYAVPEALPPNNPYPGLEASATQSVMMIAAGVQCEDALYPTEQDAVTALEAAGIPVYESATFELPVTAVCGSPTSTHYQVVIDANNQAEAEQMGWEFAE
ncbi:MAG: hypothetical protein KJ069_28310 [Anaerolineae bacterium]|nr:hypothetical protein [Anaerolineae bacterium]